MADILLLLLKEEVARVARVKPRTVDGWVQRGELRALKVGGRLNRFTVGEVARFLGVEARTIPVADTVKQCGHV
jgi:excisionase family DNA binding protein